MKYPKGTLPIFITFALYNVGLGSLYSFLVLYLEHGLHLSYGHAYYIWCTFFALFFSASLIGGHVGGRHGHHTAIRMGLISAVIGFFVLAIAKPLCFYLGLSLFITGSGFFTPNALYCLGQLFIETQHQRDSAFTICFVLSNIGVFTAAVLNGLISRYLGYPLAFTIAGCSILCAFWVFYSKVSPSHVAENRVIILSYLVTIAAASMLILTTVKWSDEVLMALGILATAGILWTISRMYGEMRTRFLICIILMLVAMAFWVLSALSPSVLIIFIEKHVQRHVLGIYIPTATYFGLSPFFIITLAPIAGFLWLRKSLPTAYKLSLGIMSMGLGYMILTPGIYFAAKGAIASSWIVASYLLQTLGEVCTAPITQSMIGTLVPKKHEAFMQGFRDFTIGLSGIFAGFLAQTTAHTNTTLSVFSHHFLLYGSIVFAIGICMFMF
jgi:POT family proton-dependent oligopeptide transporter